MHDDGRHEDLTAKKGTVSTAECHGGQEVSMLFALSLFAQPALAQEEVEPARETREVKYRQRTEIEFDGITLEGTLAGPEANLVGERARPVFPPLIELRKSFQTEMTQSVDAVK
jgi:hypothetical protein